MNQEAQEETELEKATALKEERSMFSQDNVMVFSQFQRLMLSHFSEFISRNMERWNPENGPEIARPVPGEVPCIRRVDEVTPEVACDDSNPVSFLSQFERDLVGSAIYGLGANAVSRGQAGRILEILGLVWVDGHWLMAGAGDAGRTAQGA